MPLEMPEEALITIQKRELPADFTMPQMEIAPKHYTIGMILSGDRRTITPFQQIDAHPGDMPVMPPMQFFRTFSLSDAPYVNYLVKISEQLAEDFRRDISAELFRQVFDSFCVRLKKEDSARAEAMLVDMLEVYETDAPYSQKLLKGMVYRLLVFMAEHNTYRETLRFRTEVTKEIMEVMFFIERNYREEIRLKDAADYIGFSEGHLSRRFASQVGTSFSEYLIRVRLRHVKELLLNTRQSVSEIAMDTGFSNADYLSSCFRRVEGMTPTAFRKGNV